MRSWCLRVGLGILASGCSIDVLIGSVWFGVGRERGEEEEEEYCGCGGGGGIRP